MARIHEIPYEKLNKLKIAVNEACINAMDHGNDYDPAKNVVITFEYTDESLSVSVTDSGSGDVSPNFDEPDLDEQFELFKTMEQVYHSGVVADSLGDYQLIQSIYYYRPTIIPSDDRYTIHYSPNQSAEYVRKISDQNRIYYDGMRIESIIYDKYSQFAIGGLILHRLISFLNVIYLEGSVSNISIIPIIYSNSVFK